MLPDGLRSRDCHVSFDVPESTKGMQVARRADLTSLPSSSDRADDDDLTSYDEDESNPPLRRVDNKRRRSFLTTVLNRLKVPPAFHTATEIFDEYEDVEGQEVGGGGSFEISRELLDQLTGDELDTVDELLVERLEAKKENRRLDNVMSYPMLAMQQSTNGLMGGFAIGCVTPINSPLVDWKELWFVLQDVLLLTLYGLASYVVLR